jgi:YegS/Rv2252/BmrU family lipid kinase
VQTCVIVNPSARGEKAEAFCSRLSALMSDCVFCRTTAQGEARSLAAKAVREGFGAIIAAGGDGTANEVANGIADVPQGLASVRLGVLPLGTINVFARELGMPLNLAAAIKTLARGRERSIDLGRAQYHGANGAASRCFVQLGGAGIDSRAVELVKWDLKKRFGRVSYVLAGLMALGEAQPTIMAEGDGSASGQLVLIGNGRFYAGSFEIFPNASLQDGLLDLCVLPRVTSWRAAQAMLGLATLQPLRFGASLHYRWRTVTLRSASPVSLQLDGEPAGKLPVTLSVMPKALRVIVP